MNVFKKQVANNADTLGIVLMVMLGSGLLFGVLFGWLENLELGVFVGLILGAICGNLLLLILNAVQFASGFTLGIHMGRTRKFMLASYLGERTLFGVVCNGVVLLALALANLVLQGRFVIGFSVDEFTIPSWVWPLALAVTVLVPVAIGMTLITFGRKGFWVLWGIYMVAVLAPNGGILPESILSNGTMHIMLICAIVVAVCWVVWGLWQTLRCAIK